MKDEIELAALATALHDQGVTKDQMTPPREQPSPRLLILSAEHARTQYWRDIWEFRDLLVILAWRDFSVRYKQTLMGIAWAVIRPTLTMLVFTVVFSRLAKLPADGSAPYALSVLAALMAWSLFSSILSESSASLVGNANLITKVYFPRVILPAAPIFSALVDFAVSLGIFIFLCFLFGFHPSWRVLVLPAFVLLVVLVSFGPALLMTALNVKYRDFRYVIPFILQLGTYVCPVGFSTTIVPEGWRVAYSIIPIVGVIDGFRWCLLGGQFAFYWPSFIFSILLGTATLALGIAYFRKVEKKFADVV